MSWTTASRWRCCRSATSSWGIQPARGYHIDPAASYHDPALPPPHGYLAFYAWLRRNFDAHALIHMGKHGNLEWLPGKALALSEDCLPEAAFGPLPHVYPFIVNDPGEGSQAKRRAAAVIVDHLTPPLTRAEFYGPLRELERLVDEYYDAAGVDPRRTSYLRDEILALSRRLGLDRDLGIDPRDSAGQALTKLDNHLCELKELQIRDGLHVFGTAPPGDQLSDLLVALVRVPRGSGEGGDASLLRALARDLDLDGFDPLDCAMAAPWQGDRPEILRGLSDQPWRTNGDTLERLELCARDLVAGRTRPRSRLVRHACGRGADREPHPPGRAGEWPGGNRRRPEGPRWPFRRAGAEWCPDARAARCAADRAEFLLDRQPRRADARGLALWAGSPRRC